MRTGRARLLSGFSGAGDLMLDRDALMAWLEQSCAVQGVPVVISDTTALTQIGVLLRARDAARQPPAGGERSTRHLESPSGNHSTGVESGTAPSLAGFDGRVVKNSSDDSRLAG